LDGVGGERRVHDRLQPEDQYRFEVNQQRRILEPMRIRIALAHDVEGAVQHEVFVGVVDEWAPPADTPETQRER